MTQGGPAERTVTVLYLMYQDGFKWWSLGSASSVAFVLFLFMLATSFLQARMVRAGWSS
jgi:multiple sugar transport system permease protein